MIPLRGIYRSLFLTWVRPLICIYGWNGPNAQGPLKACPPGGRTDICLALVTTGVTSTALSDGRNYAYKSNK